MQRSAKVWWICTIIILGLVLAILYHSFVGIVMRAGYPSNTFLFRSDLIFTDFFDVFVQVKAGFPLGNKACPYFPFAFVPLYALAWMSAADALKIVIFLFSAFTFWLFWRRLDFMPVKQRTLATTILTFATYPFLFCINRGNLEMIVLLLIYGFIVTFERGKYFLAAVFLACATAMKLHPGVLGVLLLHRRQYKASAVTAVVTALLTVAPAAAFPGGIIGTMELLKRNLQFFTDRIALSPDSIPFSVSYFAIFKLIAKGLGGDVYNIARVAHLPYVVFCLSLFVVVAVYILRIERTTWKQVALLSFIMVLLPDVSFDYKLIYLLVPVGLFISAPVDNSKHDHLYATLFALLLIPKAYSAIGYEITIGVVLNPLLMTLMMGHIIWTGLRSAPGVLASDLRQVRQFLRLGRRARA